MQFQQHGVNKGKVVYFIKGQSFENDQNKRNGKQKAENYCLDNFLNPADIQKFDSRLERDYYCYLLEKQKKGEISNLAHHFTLKIQDEYINSNGDVIPPIIYETDFIYFDELEKKRVVVDVKGSAYFIDERFITLKQVFDKLFLTKGLYIKVIMRNNDGWYEWHIGEMKKSHKLIEKQRIALKQASKVQHDKIIEERKNQRLIKRYKELKALSTLTKEQEKRIIEIKTYLDAKGFIIE